jgi:hypothetical protein
MRRVNRKRPNSQCLDGGEEKKLAEKAAWWAVSYTCPNHRRLCVLFLIRPTSTTWSVLTGAASQSWSPCTRSHCDTHLLHPLHPMVTAVPLKNMHLVHAGLCDTGCPDASISSLHLVDDSVACSFNGLIKSDQRYITDVLMNESFLVT